MQNLIVIDLFLNEEKSISQSLYSVPKYVLSILNILKIYYSP
jgi:hypothetical protein